MADKNKEALRLGVPDGKAQNRLEQHLAISVLEHFSKNSMPTLNITLVGTLLGGSYLNVYYDEVAASRFNTVEELAYRTSFSEKLMSDLHSVLKTLQEGPLNFALTDILKAVKELGRTEAKYCKDAAVKIQDSVKGSGRIHGWHNRVDGPSESYISIPISLADVGGPLRAHLENLKLKPATMIAPAMRAHKEDPTVLYTFNNLTRLPVQDVEWIALQLIKGTPEVSLVSHVGSNRTSYKNIKLNTQAPSSLLVKDEAVRCVRALRDSVPPKIAKHLILAYEDAVTNLTGEVAPDGESPLCDFHVDEYGDTCGWQSDEAQRALFSGEPPLVRYQEALDRVKAIEDALRSAAARAVSLHQEMSKTLAEHEDLRYLGECNDICKILPSLLRYVFLDASRLPELQLVLADAAGLNTAYLEADDRTGMHRNRFIASASSILKVLRSIQPLVNDPVFRKAVMAEATRLARAASKT